MKDPHEVWTNETYLKEKQYKTADNLTARATLHRRFSTNPYPWQLWVFEQLGLQAGDRVLECGCGPGWLWRENVARLATGVQVTLTDLSPGMVDTAMAALAAHPAFTGQGDVNMMALPFADDAFDVVVANHMLYHVSDRAQALAEVQRVLKPGGRFVAATNGKKHLLGLRHWAQILGLDEPINMDSSAALFGLENGRAQLEPWFEVVQLLDYPDSLRVTEVEPLVAYVYSMVGQVLAVTEAQVATLRQAITAEMDKQGGVIEIGKKSGLFLCQGYRLISE